MQKDVHATNKSLLKPSWVTIREAVKITNKLKAFKIAESDIYRHALYGNISLSIYFQSPPLLRKIKSSLNKIKLRPAEKSLRYRICMLDVSRFLNDHDFIFSTEGKYITPNQLVINTGLRGYEFVLVQRLLAHSLNIHLPVTGANETNYGITVTFSDQTYQVFEKRTWQERIKRQIMQLHEHNAPDIYVYDSVCDLSDCSGKAYFPIYDLPDDACFVIRQDELDRFLNTTSEGLVNSSSSRISTPLSRLFWLACKHNDSISPLLRHPYKLLPIFEQWASIDGITDHLSGDTLKRALERGCPASVTK
jgi:hypothetical protein